MKSIDSARRLLKTAVAGTAAAMYPWTAPRAQSPGLLGAPKQALVLGNGRYKQSPLKNPVNDAKGMAAALQLTGFEVKLGLDVSQACRKPSRAMSMHSPEHAPSVSSISPDTAFSSHGAITSSPSMPRSRASGTFASARST